MTQFRYVKQNYGCHCFYNDSSLKRYNRYHSGGNTLIFNFGGGGYNNCMSPCCGLWGGMTNWLGGCWGGFTNWLGGCCGNMFGGKGFWGGLGAGLGMGLMSFAFGGGIQLLSNWLGSLGKSKSSSAAADSSKSSPESETPAKPSEVPTEKTPSEVLNEIGDISNITDPKELKNISEKLKDLLNKPGLSDADKQKAEDLLKQVQDKLKLAGELGLGDDEIIVGGEVLKIDDLTPEKIAKLTSKQIADLSADDIEKIKAAGKLDELLKKLSVDKIKDDKGNDILTLPGNMDVNSVKALAKLSNAAGIPVAMGYNSNPEIRDHYIAGYIDPESVKEDEAGKISYDIDCEELAKVNRARFGNRYTVTQKDDENYNIKISKLRKGKINPRFEATGVEYKLNGKRLERKGEAYIKG